MSIKKEWVEKIKKESFAMNKPYWAISFNFGGLRNDENLYIIDEQLFKALQEYLGEED